MAEWLLTDEEIKAIQIPQGLDIETTPLWWDKLIAKAQDTKTKRKLVKWLDEHGGPHYEEDQIPDEEGWRRMPGEGEIIKWLLAKFLVIAEVCCIELLARRLHHWLMEREYEHE